MVRIVVFDSGFGSLSIISELKKYLRAEIIYFADQKNYPYGTKKKNQLKKIITQTISNLKDKFNPDLIIVGSNTPTILFSDEIKKYKNVIGVVPPLDDAVKLTKTKSIGIAGTQLVCKSKQLDTLIAKEIPRQIKVKKIDATRLIDLVESGKFVSSKNFCRRMIQSELEKIIISQKIDVVTLSSTHLPFLLPLFEQIFPSVNFLDPAEKLADFISRKFSNYDLTKNSLKIFTSGDPKLFQKLLRKIGVRKKVQYMEF